MNRFSSFDLIKGIAALLIVCLHCENSDVFDSILHLMGRMAVPMFFIITGFFLPKLIKKGLLNKHIVKILKITLLSSILYILLFFIDSIVLNKSFQDINSLFSWEQFKYGLLFGRNPINNHGGHLWYLFSILYVMFFVYLFIKKYNISRLYVLIVPLFLIGYVLSSIQDMPRPYYQNYLLIGLPYVLLGSLISEQSLETFFTNKRVKILLSVCALLYVLEIGLYVSVNLPAHREHYLMIIPTVSLILIWCKHNPQAFQKSLLARIGRDYSLYIYVFHFYIVQKMWICFHGEVYSSKLQMSVSLILTLFICHLYIKMKYRKTI